MQKIITAAAVAAGLLSFAGGAAQAQSYFVVNEADLLITPMTGAGVWSTRLYDLTTPAVYYQNQNDVSAYVQIGSLANVFAATNVSTFRPSGELPFNVEATALYSSGPIAISGPADLSVKVTIGVKAVTSAFGSGYGVVRLLVDGKNLFSRSVGSLDGAMVTTDETLTYTTILSGGQSLSFVALAGSEANRYGSAQFGPGYGSAYMKPTVTFETLSNIPAVPESSTWALMVSGFGALGFALRRRRLATA